MAQAWTADDFGSSDESGGGRAGDCRAEYATLPCQQHTTRLALDLRNLTDRPQTLNVALSASGLLQLDGAAIPPYSWRPARAVRCYLSVSAPAMVLAMVR